MKEYYTNCSNCFIKAIVVFEYNYIVLRKNTQTKKG